jgi:hypothetical protein
MIVAARWNGSSMEHVVHENSAYIREDGTTILRGPRDGLARFWTQGKTTFVGRGTRVVALEAGRVVEELGVDICAGEPAFAVNDRYAFFVQGGRLWRRTFGQTTATLTGLAGKSAEPWGDVLAGQTRIWVGERIGFGYYRAGNVSVAFTFDVEKRGIRDAVRLPWPNGQIVRAEAAVDADRVWFFLAFAIAGRIVNRIIVLSADATVLGTADADSGDGSWLGTISGKCAVAGMLFAATDTGIVRVEVGSGVPAEVKRFADTEPFVQAGARLFVARDGMWVVDNREIKTLAME